MHSFCQVFKASTETIRKNMQNKYRCVVRFSWKFIIFSCSFLVFLFSCCCCSSLMCRFLIFALPCRSWNTNLPVKKLENPILPVVVLLWVAEILSFYLLDAFCCNFSFILKAIIILLVFSAYLTYLRGWTKKSTD